MTTAALSSSELRYRRLFEAAHDGILIIDPSTGKIIDVNPFLLAFLGYTRDELLGKELYEIGLLKDQSANQHAFRDLQKRGFIRYEDLPLQAKDGRCLEVEFVSNLYEEGDTKVIQCNIRDIGSRKSMEFALKQAKETLNNHSVELEAVVKLRTAELRQSNSQLEMFVYSIAHDLRAPLRTMQGFAQLLVQDNAATLNEQSRSYANFINEGAQTMDNLLTDLLEFSHIDLQKIDLAPLELEQVVLNAVSACEREIRESKAVVEMIPPWPIVMAHSTTLQQVLVNLLTNALKFVSSASPRVRIRTEERPSKIVRIWVEDNGIGIPVAFQNRIFQVFQRLHTTQYTGTGIGLAIVQKGMERMFGRAGVVSTLGSGSKFWVELAKAPPAIAILANERKAV